MTTNPYQSPAEPEQDDHGVKGRVDVGFLLASGGILAIISVIICGVGLLLALMVMPIQ